MAEEESKIIRSSHEKSIIEHKGKGSQEATQDAPKPAPKQEEEPLI